MPKPTKGPRMGGSPAHQRIIMANLATQLFEHGKITTTLARAKRVQPLADHLITKAKRGDLHAIRTVAKTITDKGVLDRLFKTIGPSMKNREGGYTRVTKIGNRQGDAAPMAVIEIITEEVSPKKVAPKKAAAPKAEPKKAVEEVVEDIIDDDTDAVPEAEEAVDAEDAAEEAAEAAEEAADEAKTVAEEAAEAAEDAAEEVKD
ncbi:MAG: 50S ribosomal protein L17 [Propionibacteriaceae bacterium]|nr:50S ribosomal protein L17 [Propionibacteriaceae bacterium]